MNKKTKEKVIKIFLDLPNRPRKPLSDEYLKAEAKALEERKKQSKIEQERIKMSREKLHQEFTI